MDNMENKPLQLSPKMRRQLWYRIGYSFALSLLVRPAVVYGVFFGVSVQLFRELVFVQMVFKNFLAVEVGQVPSFVWQLLVTADKSELAALVVMMISFILLARSLQRPGIDPVWQPMVEYGR